MPTKPVLSRLSAVLLGAVLYSTLVVCRVVPRYDCLFLPAALLLAFRAIDGVAPRRRFGALVAVTIVLATGALLNLWIAGYEGRSAVIGGIIPWSDSHDYASDSLRLAHGEPFSPYAARRPLFPALLSGLLRASGDDLRASLVVLMLLGACGFALATHEVWRTHGYKSAWLVYVVLYLFERRWAGFVQTEHLGAPLGALGFAIFWRYVARPAPERPRDDAYLATGLLVLSLALLARPGPFFVLPSLLVWAARRRKGRERLRRLAWGAAAIVLAFALNRAALSGLSTGGVSNFDFPAITYGMLHGEGQRYVCEHHPEVCALPVHDQVDAIDRLIARDVANQPSLLVRGLGGSLASHVASPFGLFSMVWQNPDDRILENAAVLRSVLQARGVLGIVGYWCRTLGVLSFVNAVVTALGAVAFALGVPAAALVAWRRRAQREPYASMLLAAALGVLLSAPVLPPWITPSLQIQSTTMALLAALPAVVFLGGAAAATPAHFPRATLACVAAGGLCAMAALVLFTRFVPSRPPADRTACASPDRALLHVLRDTEVELGPRSSSLRAKSMRDLERNMMFMSKHNEEVVASLAPFQKEGTVIAYAYDACDASAKVVVDDAHVLARDDASWMAVAITPLERPDIVHVDRL